MPSQRCSGALGAGLLLVAFSAFGQVAITTATSAPPSPQLPPVGLAVTETAQVNVVNTALPPSLGGAAPNCSGTIAFYGGAGGGSILGPVAAFEVGYGQMFSVALPYASTGASGPRTVIRVAITLSAIRIPTATGIEIAPCTLASSLETYDTATGVTHAFASGVATQGLTSILREAQPVAVR
jgi:hypothetical protein